MRRSGKVHLSLVLRIKWNGRRLEVGGRRTICKMAVRDKSGLRDRCIAYVRAEIGLGLGFVFSTY